MDKAVQILVQDLATIRAGRANPSLLDHIKIKAYGGTTELTVAELANIATSDAKTITLTPFDQSVLEELEHGLRQANLGVTVAVDGSMIRVVVPPMTEERREEFIKLANMKTEGVRVMLRQIRHEAINKIRDMLQNKEIPEDEKFRLEKEVQKSTDDAVSQAESLLKKKVEELKRV